VCGPILSGDDEDIQGRVQVTWLTTLTSCCGPQVVKNFVALDLSGRRLVIERKGLD
jgi:hypothetical protein